MKKFKRMLAWLLIMSMAAGYLPAKAEAAGSDPIYVLAGGDYQQAGDHSNSAENVEDILTQVSQKYTTMDGFLFIGDYDCETHDSASETAAGITSLMDTVDNTYSNINHTNSVLVQGNHDYKDSNIDATGGHDFDGYSVYVLNEDDYPNGGGSQSQIQTLAGNLETWLNNKLGEGYDAPVFITSHLPLAFSPRTVTQGDAKYAKLIFDVLNTAADNGLNIIFLFGHDHAYGPDNYMGGEAIYLPEGDKIAIAETGSTSAYTWETLNFTYMNAGYTGYYSDPYTYVTNAGTDKLTMSVFKIEDNQVTVERYSANGLYNLKSAGYDGSYSNTSVTNQTLGLGVNSTVYASPQTISLGDVEDYGTIGEYVGVESQTPTDDVTPANEGWIELIAPVVGSTTYTYNQEYNIEPGKQYVIVDGEIDNVLNYSVTGNGYYQSINMVGNNVASSNGVITSTVELPLWTFSGTGTATVNNGDYYLSGGSSISIRSYESNIYVVDNGENFTLKRRERNAGYALYYNGSSWITSDSSTQENVRLFVFTSSTPTGGSSGTYGKIAGDLTYNATAGMTADQAMDLVKSGIDGYYYEAMSTPDSNVTGTKVDDSVLTWQWIDTFDGNTAGDYEVAIKYGDLLLGTAEVVVPPSTTYYIAEGNGIFYVDMNTTSDNAMAAVKAGVTVYSATDINGTGKTAISDSDVTWQWKDTYNGADSGPYTVEILKDGTSLGTVEVKVNVKYTTEIKPGWTYIGETEATGGTYTYTLDTDGIDYGEEHKYIIVDDNEAIVLNANSASNGTAHSITINGNTASLSTRDYEYHMIKTSYNGTRYELITKGNGSEYLYQENNGVRYGTRSSVKFQVNHHGSGIYDIHDIDGDNWYILYNGGWTVTKTTSARVRLYKYTGTTGGTGGGTIYAKLEGNTIYTVDQGTSASQALSKVKAGITAYVSSNIDGSNSTELADNDLTYKWKNTYTSMVTGSYWVEISYKGVVLGTVEVRVKPGVIKNYPEYPDEGAVKVSKSATGIDFQSSGIAQVEISASGVPVKKGADVIVMLDTSSSMTSHTVTGTDKTRAAVLEESLKNLIAQFKEPGDDGEPLDLRVAIADFNGFYGDNHNSTGTPYDRDAEDMMSDDISYNANSEAKVYTGNGTLGAGAFIDAEDLAETYVLNYTSGTNYDYAMDAIYQMGTAIKEANGTEERDLYVIFMSDGAAMQWNYYHSQGASSLWNNWLCGNWGVDDLSLNCNTHAYYYNDVDTDGDGMMNEHRMANAIKGSPSETYEVIRKTNTLGTPTSEENMYMVAGLGAKMFSISFDAQADTNVTEETMDLSIETLASEQTGTTKYYYKVTSAEELTSAFDAIGNEIAYAANNARYVDQMGEDFNLQLKTSTYEVVENNQTVEKTLQPKIEIITYDIYTRQDYQDGTITADKIGDRKGTYTILETVTFSEDGTKAYSDQIGGGTTNILADGSQAGYTKGVIYAKTFLYNTAATDVAVDGVNIPTSIKNDGTTKGTTNVLPSETFYWKLGTVQTSELAMRYHVYLEGSMEGTCPAGSYETNEFATLYYDNYLGNPCYKDTVSPVMAWKEANVSYAFYLVDDKGNIIVNQTTGQTGSFANKIAVTNPVIYETVFLNNTDQFSALEVRAISEDVLPKYYELYDEEAVYEVGINSNSTGNWTITKGDDLVNSTYVTQYKPSDSSAYSNALTNSTIGDDYTHTIVWFAVKWKVEAHPDAVVVDYGLPVNISVLTNDMFGDYGKLTALGEYDAVLETVVGGAELASGFGLNYTGKYGVANANTTTGKVTYTPNNMEMDGYDKFTYAVDYIGTENAGYYYDSVTVIPATNIYYEDSFVAYESYTWDYGKNAWSKKNTSLWSVEGETNTDAKQDEDRPGKYSLTDANNIYGYDSVNLGMSTYSLGSAHKATVDYDNYAQAQFTFYGTGFDIISMTSSMTGTILVDVEKKIDGKWTEFDDYVVDTYYGYKQVAGDADKDGTVEEGEMIWVVDPEANDSLYQVPVIKMANKEYGQYRVTIKATYDSIFDHVAPSNDTGSYDFYLDAIRIYDPANDGASDGTEDTTIENAYKADGEGWPSYIELRNKLIAAKSFDEVANDKLTADMEGLVFIDGDASVGNAQLADYTYYGPNNEVYLAPGQRVAFMVNTPENIANIHIGIKSADGGLGTYTITNIAQNDITQDKVEAGDYYNAKTSNINTATEMYYDLTRWKDDIIVISNTGDRYDTDGIISLTNIKSTYTSNPNEAITRSRATEVNSYETSIYMTAEAAATTLKSLNKPVEEEKEEVIKEKAEVFSVTTDKVSYTNLDTVKVTVMTNDAAEYVTVNGEKITEFKEEAGVREWSYGVKVSKIGKFTFKTVAYNEDDEASEEIIKFVDVNRFVPKTFKLMLNKKNVIVGEKVKATVTTSTDVKYVTINGKKVTKYTNNKAKGTRTFALEVKVTKTGKMTFKSVAYNTKGSASKEISAAVTAKKFAPKTFKVALSKSTVKKGQQYTVTVTTSADVKYVTVNGKKITKYTSNKSKTSKTFKVTYKAVTTGKKNVKVIAYNNNGSASNAKTKTVTVKK